MRKRAFCALWMAVFAALAGFPTWNPLSPPGVWMFAVTSPALAGAVMGAVVQAPAIGNRTTPLGAALAGILCAALSLPLMIFGVQVIFGFPGLVKSPSNIGAVIFVTIFGSVFALKGLWWSILPMGALGGLTLQIFWRWKEGR